TLDDGAAAYCQVRMVTWLESLHSKVRSRWIKSVLLELLAYIRQEGMKVTPKSELARAKQELARFVELGVLVSEESLIRYGGDRERDRGISTVAIVTKNRPQYVRRCLESLCANLNMVAGPVVVCVYDDSEDEQTERVVNEIRSGLMGDNLILRHVGQKAKRELAKRLAAAGEIQTDLVEFGIFRPYPYGPGYGANLNSVLLSTAGQLVICMDDDVVLPLRAWSEPDGALRLASTTDPTDVATYLRRADAIASVIESEDNIIECHLRLLGRTLSGCLAESHCAADLSGMAPTFVSSLLGGDSRVAVTMTGIVGDAGTSITEWLVRGDGSWRRLTTSELDYQSLVNSREVVRGVRSCIITDGRFFMNACAGFDNRELLPPFLPVMRNMDGVFAALLRFACPELHIGYLPRLVVHDPPERPAVQAILKGPRLSEYLIAAIQEASSMVVEGSDASSRMRLIGRYLTEVGSLSRVAFEGWLRRQAHAFIMGRIKFYDNALRNATDAPYYWIDRVSERLVAFRKLLTSGDLSLAADDLIAGRKSQEACAITQDLVRDYGRLVESWPVFMAAARDITVL
ncbi:MAG: glycosyltransferase family 2 protein, partial [Blastocatellia bacterium]